MNDMRIMTVLKGNEKYRKYQLLLSNYRAAACHVGPQSVNNSLQTTEKMQCTVALWVLSPRHMLS